MDFTAFIQDKLQDVTGRVWVFYRIDARPGSCSYGRFLITGGPGTG
jgi:hypothetical protein